MRINKNYVKKFGLTQHKILGDLQAGKTITWKGKKITPAKGTFVVKGKKIVYITDTSYFKGLDKFAKDADVLIAEATYGLEYSDKAKERSHLTSKSRM